MGRPYNILNGNVIDALTLALTVFAIVQKNDLQEQINGLQ